MSGARHAGGTTTTAQHSAAGHVVGLDALRAVGALMIVTTHVGFHSGDGIFGPFAGVLARMDIGVAIFFVLSGFLLFRPHASAWFDGTARPRPGRYFKHRAWRILPALWLTVAAAAALLEMPDSVRTRDILAHAALVQIYVPTAQVSGLTQMWSLATEVAFYMVLPLVAALLLGRRPYSHRRLRTVLIILLTTPLVGMLWMAATTGERGGLWLPAHLGWFGLGLALALWRGARIRGLLPLTPLDEVARQPLSLWALAAALYLLVSTPLAGPYDLAASSVGAAVFKNGTYSLMAALILLPAVAPGGGSRRAVAFLDRRPLRILGEISYGIFCYHLIVLELVEGALGVTLFDASFWQIWFPTVALTLVVAAASYYGVERPLARRARRGERTARAGASAAPTAKITSI